jgi:hypothetical protein
MSLCRYLAVCYVMQGRIRQLETPHAHRVAQDDTLQRIQRHVIIVPRAISYHQQVKSIVMHVVLVDMLIPQVQLYVMHVLKEHFNQ